MAETKTTTVASTFSRLDAVWFIALYLVKGLSGTNTARDTALIEKGLRQNQWVEVVEWRAVDGSNKFHMQLQFRIDWERYTANVSMGKKQLDIAEVPFVGRAIDTLIETFTTKVKEGMLKVEIVFTMRKEVYEIANRELGLVPTTSKPYHESGNVILAVEGEHLDESSLVFTVYSDQLKQSNRRYSGTVKRWNMNFGYIDCGDLGADVFTHVSYVHGGEELLVGAMVTFEIMQGRKGPIAINVKTVQGD